MKPLATRLATLTVFALVMPALSGPAAAETSHDVYQRCIGASMTNDTSDQCVALRARFNALVQDCMATASEATQNSVAKASYTSHGYRARYQLCSGDVAQRLGNYGH